MDRFIGWLPGNLNRRTRILLIVLLAWDAPPAIDRWRNHADAGAVLLDCTPILDTFLAAPRK